MLPPALLLAVLALLPAGARLRCAAVCRAWRLAVKERSLWLRLNLVDVQEPMTAARLRGYSALAGGQLQSLDLLYGHDTWNALCGVAAANTELDSVTLHSDERDDYVVVDSDQLEELLLGAPHLMTLRVGCAALDAARDARLIRKEPPFGPLQLVDRLDVEYNMHGNIGFDDVDDQTVPEIVADLLLHPLLSKLVVHDAKMDAPGSWDRLVDAAVALRLRSLELFVGPGFGAAEALTRLFSTSTALTHFEWCKMRSPDDMTLFDSRASVDAMAAALRANNSLTSLAFYAPLWRNIADATTLLEALTAHSSLSSLSLDPRSQAVAVGPPLAGIVLADAPALHELVLGTRGFSDDSLGLAFDALAHNTHIRILKCSGRILSDALVRHHLLPALRANRGLQKLELGDTRIFPMSSLMHEAVTLVAARGGTPPFDDA